VKGERIEFFYILIIIRIATMQPNLLGFTVPILMFVTDLGTLLVEKFFVTFGHFP
jgi:hypothetical protein